MGWGRVFPEEWLSGSVPSIPQYPDTPPKKAVVAHTHTQRLTCIEMHAFCGYRRRYLSVDSTCLCVL